MTWSQAIVVSYKTVLSVALESAHRRCAEASIQDDYGFRRLCDAFGFFFFFSSRRRHTRLQGDWSSDVCSSDLASSSARSSNGRRDASPWVLRPTPGQSWPTRASANTAVKPGTAYYVDLRSRKQLFGPEEYTCMEPGRKYRQRNRSANMKSLVLLTLAATTATVALAQDRKSTRLN